MEDKTVTFDIDELRQRAGSATFAKAIQLVKSESVHHLRVEEGDVLATVEGTFPYQVQLIKTTPITCYCTCPAAEYQEVCKHAVAVAMQANVAPPETSDEKAILYRYFVQQSPQALTEIILDGLRKSDVQWNRWLTLAQLDENSVTLAQLTHRVDDALPQVTLWGWGESQGYFDDADIQLEVVWTALESLSPEEQWSLILYVIERLNLVLEDIDDSDGARSELEQIISEKMPVIFEQLDWGERRKAHWLFEHLTQTEFDVFPDLEDAFFTCYASNATFLALCQQRLDELVVSEGARWRAERIAAPLIYVAREAGHWQEEVRINALLAERCHHFIELSRLCLRHDEALDAERWLMKARHVIEHDHERERCDRQEVEIREALGEYHSAWSLARRLFSASPSYQEYLALCQLKIRGDIDAPTFLTHVEQTFKTAYEPPEGRYVSARSDDLLRFYIEQRRLDAACAWVDTRKVSTDALIELANEVVTDKPDTALMYYSRVVCVTIEQTNNSAYEQALRYLQSLEKRLAHSPETMARFHAEVRRIAQTYKRKRNMLALLKQHYAHCL